MTGCYVGGNPKRNPGEHGTGLKTRHYSDSVRDDGLLCWWNPKRNPGEHGTGLKTRHYSDFVRDDTLLDGVLLGVAGLGFVLRPYAEWRRAVAVLRPYGIDARLLVDSVW